MTQPASSAHFNNGGQDEQFSDPAEGRERGARRRKLAGYLKAANELRQSYQQSYGQGWSQSQRDLGTGQDDQAFSDVAIVRSGHEEMMLFPSYARYHIKTTPKDDKPATLEGDTQPDSAGSDGNAIKSTNAVIDCDVRGWLYTPHRGPLNKKNRLMLGLARRLSGIPAPSEDIDTSQQSGHEARVAQREEELVSQEAAAIEKRGRDEADVAWHGGFSEDPRRGTTSAAGSGTSTPNEKDVRLAHVRHAMADTSLEDGGKMYSPRRSSWNQPSEMSPAELRTANAHLMARLKPFLSWPMVNQPVTVFFYNGNTSQSRTIVTNEAGHFSIRASLDFTPTDVRVLASDSLSATEEVRLIQKQGVSLISDIDDTIKHSAIGSGAREIFRNTFIRELGDLTIDGVREWYTKLHDLGVQMHYVSNSPWQLYPLISSYFALAGLPPGSFHLKQYSGMLQGIFEPVAERKRGTLERILGDFPERSFFLVGDSGEADLEVYVEVVLAHPNRILGIYIRDVTTQPTQGFFSSSMASEPRKPTNTHPKEEKVAPALPPNKPPQSERQSGPTEGKLIDFGQDDSELDDKAAASAKPKASPPPRPVKPEALRSRSSSTQASGPSSQVNALSTGSHATPSTSRPPSTYYAANAEPQDNSKRTFIRQKIASAYNSLPYLYEPTNSDSDGGSTGTRTPSGIAADTRRSLASYPAAAASYANSKLWGEGNGVTAGDDPNQANTKEELWKRRWARAKEVLDAHGVELKSWRVGSDAEQDSVDLTQRAIEDLQKQGTRRR